MTIQSRGAALIWFGNWCTVLTLSFLWKLSSPLSRIYFPSLRFLQGRLFKKHPPTASFHDLPYLDNTRKEYRLNLENTHTLNTRTRKNKDKSPTSILLHITQGYRPSHLQSGYFSSHPFILKNHYPPFPTGGSLGVTISINPPCSWFACALWLLNFYTSPPHSLFVDSSLEQHRPYR